MAIVKSSVQFWVSNLIKRMRTKKKERKIICDFLVESFDGKQKRLLTKWLNNLKIKSFVLGHIRIRERAKWDVVNCAMQERSLGNRNGKWWNEHIFYHFSQEKFIFLLKKNTPLTYEWHMSFSLFSCGSKFVCFAF